MKAMWQILTVVLVVGVCAGFASGDSVISYELWLDGDNHADLWEVGVNVPYTLVAGGGSGC